MVKWHIGTFARIRPPRRSHECAKFILEKLDNGSQTAARISFPPPGEGDELSASERLSMKQRELLQFQFSNIFDPGVSQDDIFNSVCRDIVYSALDGYNGTILAYGQTGSGKTYTITGGEHYADRGIIPRVLSTMFEEFERRSPNVRYSCFISYLEIYNENVYDLLDRSHTDRPVEEWTKVLLMDDDEGEMHFRNLGVYEAVSEEEALNLLFLGNMNRVTSDTPMNQASSRSHSIFSVMIEARPVDSEVIVTSKLHLVDLAGSERVYKREGTQRMRTEGKHINLSLHHLEQVILSLRTSKRSHGSTMAKSFHVPYRNSMLTSVLRGSLGGNCKSVFIATLNPESEFVDESISTCRFMQRCSEVSVDVVVNTEVDTEKRLQMLEKSNTELETSNFDLKSRLVQLESELKAASSHVAKYQKDQTLWQRERAELQVEMMQLHAKQQQQAGEKLNWSVCEELVEKLLLSGDVPRIALERDRDEEEDQRGDDDEDEERREARQLFQETTREIRRRGVECALGCLTLMRESTVFASNTAVELQEMMGKQRQTVELLEKRLHEQRQDAEQLKSQVKQLLQEQSTLTATTAENPKGNLHDQPQKRNATGSKDSGGGGGGGRGDSSHSLASSRNKLSRGGSDASDSDSDLDSEAPDSRHYPHPHHQQLQHHQSSTTMSLVFNTASRTASTVPPAPVAPLPAQSSKQSLQNPASDAEDSVVPLVKPPQPPQPPKTGSDMIRRRMDLLKNGSLFVKYGRYGKPHVRFVWCSVDLEYLHYRQASAQVAKASIPTRNMQRITLGQSTKVFERAKQPSREPFCFSIEYEEGTSRTLDLEVTDGDSADQKKLKRSEWVEALQFLIKLKAAQQKKPPAMGTPPTSSAPATS